MRPGSLFRASWRDLRAARHQDASYRRIWQAFRQHERLADGRHDTADWRSHDGVFVGCVIRVPAEALQPALGEFRDELSVLPYIRLHPDHFLHLMLQEIGFVCPVPRRRTEWSAARLDEYIAAATGAMAGATSFDIRIGGANSFQDAAFLDVHDRGACARLHTRLRDLAAVPMEPRFAYLPHLTVAHYLDAVPISNLPAVIGRFRDRRFGSFQATQIEVMSLQLDEPYPELEVRAVIPLADS